MAAAKPPTPWADEYPALVYGANCPQTCIPGQASSRPFFTGRHFHTAPIRQDGKTPNGGRLPIHEERWEAAGKYDGVGLHTFRHTYRSWLDDTGAPVGVQQKLMRHAQVSTTMNIYGNALMVAKWEANSKVVRMALRSA
ncbi:MAG TPA: tyrosine-type recombinase/integrase [Edaphobacter sp.]|nr:tyrosine-type recombinase/integrase [Edaphobacter sp.]